MQKKALHIKLQIYLLPYYIICLIYLSAILIPDKDKGSSGYPNHNRNEANLWYNYNIYFSFWLFLLLAMIIFW